MARRRGGRVALGFVGLLAAVVLAALSGEAYQRMGTSYVLYEGVDPGFDSTHVVEGGWPLAYLQDRPFVTSPANSVDFFGGVAGLDTFRVLPFLADAAFFFLVLALPWRLMTRRRRTASDAAEEEGA